MRVSFLKCQVESFGSMASSDWGRAGHTLHKSIRVNVAPVWGIEHTPGA